MKDKILFIISIVFSFVVFIHLFVIGFTCDSEIILGTFQNGNQSSIKKVSLLIYISLLMIFSLIVIIPNYLKDKRVNFNMFMAYILLELFMNLLPYFSL